MAPQNKEKKVWNLLATVVVASLVGLKLYSDWHISQAEAEFPL